MAQPSSGASRRHGVCARWSGFLGRLGARRDVAPLTAVRANAPSFIRPFSIPSSRLSELQKAV
jgi:hypothetical protein